MRFLYRISEGYYFCLVFVHFLFSCFAYPTHLFFTHFSHNFLFFIYTIMSKSTRTWRKLTQVPQLASPRDIVSSTTRKWQNFSYQSEHGTNFIKDRWLYIKTREIVSDLQEILRFAKKMEKTEDKHLVICDQVNGLLSKLEWGKRDNQYMKIVQVITKYLDGIRNFVMNNNIEIRWAVSYRVLFESTMIAIVREVDCLEQQVC